MEIGCDWACSEIRCVVPLCPFPVKCKNDSCNEQGHHACQLEYKMDVESFIAYCGHHDPIYASRHQMQVQPVQLENMSFTNNDKDNEAGDAVDEEGSKVM